MILLVSREGLCLLRKPIKSAHMKIIYLQIINLDLPSIFITFTIILIFFLVFRFLLPENFKKRIVKVANDCGDILITETKLDLDKPSTGTFTGLTISHNLSTDFNDDGFFIYLGEISNETFFFGSHYLERKEIIDLLPPRFPLEINNLGLLIFRGWEVSNKDIEYLFGKIREFSKSEREASEKFVLVHL